MLRRHYRKDGSAFWNELTVSPVLNDNRVLTHYIGIQHDVTERENSAQVIALTINFRRNANNHKCLCF